MIYKSRHHTHFWIKNGVLFEGYARGTELGYSIVMEVSGMPDEKKCSEACMIYIDKEYCQTA